jgi:hypothetical protein
VERGVLHRLTNRTAQNAEDPMPQRVIMPLLALVQEVAKVLETKSVDPGFVVGQDRLEALHPIDEDGRVAVDEELLKGVGVRPPVGAVDTEVARRGVPQRPTTKLGSQQTPELAPHRLEHGGRRLRVRTQGAGVGGKCKVVHGHSGDHSLVVVDARTSSRLWS